mmetsp:Transcript_30062/g.45292  ORF Transcript_30062/g.45292 Transcript_30062/m.45292 type:complete len:117 (-) Transcript_30062:167-517(-)
MLRDARRPWIPPVGWREKQRKKEEHFRSGMKACTQPPASGERMWANKKRAKCLGPDCKAKGEMTKPTQALPTHTEVGELWAVGRMRGAAGQHSLTLEGANSMTPRNSDSMQRCAAT